jgi:hypothetical protein
MTTARHGDGFTRGLRITSGVLGLALAAYAAFAFDYPGATLSVVAGAGAALATQAVGTMLPAPRLAALALFFLVPLLIVDAARGPYVVAYLAMLGLLMAAVPRTRRLTATDQSRPAAARMLRNLDLPAAIILVVLGAIALGAAAIAVVRDVPYVVQGAEALAIVEQVEPSNVGVAQISYSFTTPDGAVFRGSGRVPISHLGRELPVRYLPAAPSSNRPRAETFADRVWELALVVAFGLLALGVGVRQVATRSGRR